MVKMISKRESEILDILVACEHNTNKHIARKLGILENTVKKHMCNIASHSGLKGRVTIALWWKKQKELEPVDLPRFLCDK